MDVEKVTGDRRVQRVEGGQVRGVGEKQPNSFCLKKNATIKPNCILSKNGKWKKKKKLENLLS